MIGVITAGGKGTRLSSVTKDIPKPMVNILGKPLLQYQIECLKENNIKEIYILIGHLGSVIKDYFKDGSDFGVSIKYIEEKEPLGSAGSLFFLKDIIKEDFIFVFGDLIFDIYFQRMIDFHKKHKASITLFTHPNSHPFDSDIILTNDDDMVIGIDSKNNTRDYYFHNLVNAGVYIVSPKILDTYHQECRKIDFEKDIVSKELINKSVFSYHSTEYVKDAGTVERLEAVSEDIKNGIVSAKNLRNPQKCIFIDRDGTINKLVGFLRNIDDIELEKNVTNGLKTINKSKYLAIVITNQPVIARGEVSVSELKRFHDKIESLLGKEGAYIDDLFYCPHHPDSGFPGEIKELKIDCDCRKPKIGLLLKAKEKYNIDLKESYFVGDSTMDIQTGKNAQMKTVLVKTGQKGQDGIYDVSPDYLIDDLGEIGHIIGRD